MDTIDTIRKDKVYLKCKVIVKNWEKDFKTKNSRTPSRLDIKEAPSKIKYAYKKYFQLKSTALENTLLGCDIDENDEPFGSPEPLQHLDIVTDDPINSPLEQSFPILPSGQELQAILLNENIKKTEAQNDKANMCNLNNDKILSSTTCDLNNDNTISLTACDLNNDKSLKSTTCDLNNDKMLSPFTSNLSKKLFMNKTFTLRNPRKSLLPKSHCNVENKKCFVDKDDNSKELPSTSSNMNNLQFSDFLSVTNDSITNETLNNDISFPRSHKSAIDIKNPVVRQLNEAWLERATGMVVQEVTGSEKVKGYVEKFGLNNIKISQTVDESCDYVENSESEEDITLAKLKPALKKRKIDSQKGSYTRVTVTAQNQNNESHDEHKANKIDIKIKKPKRNRKSKGKTKVVKEEEKKSEEQPPDIAEYLPFGLKENVTPRLSKVSNILEEINSTNKNVNIKKLPNTKIEYLEKKIINGTINDNFVKINIEKKIFVRGKKNISYSKYKKQQWKDKKAFNAGMDFPESGKVLCYKCGTAGHMARYCTSHKGETLLPLESYNDNELLTLQDCTVSEEGNSLSLEQLNVPIYEPSQIPDSFMKLLAKTPNNNENPDIKPVFKNYQEETPKELYEALHMFGYETFRPGQEQTIMRILCGMSTLLILSTGGGKSLCYQIPAYIYSKYNKCITLVISPLVSLMEDQVLNMPEFVKAGCLHTNQPPTQRRKIMQCLKEGKINILLISPEALISGDASNGFTGLFKLLPPIAFACIDEAHCVSQWSHNFRPSYLMICRVLREKLNIKCILGLTATASQSTINSIIGHIDIPDGVTGVIANLALPHNLCLSVSFEKDKDRALISYLTSERINSFNSIIVYCIRRDECERVAAILRSCLQENGKINMERQNNKRKKMSYIAEAYHAGMSAAQRKKIQNNFISGTLKIIVATVAFGMGINKSNIRCIIHYNMPRNFESYVQEVGRAGRDGQLAYCHVFMNDSNSDKNELLKHIYANTIDRQTIRKLLQKVFIPCECNKDQENTSLNKLKCTGHEIGIPIESTVEELDLPSENIATLLCYLELHSKQYIKVLNNAYVICKIVSYGGPQKIIEAAKSCAPLGMAYLMKRKKDPDVIRNNVLEFNVIEVAAAIGWESGMSKYCLKNLEWITEGGISKRSQLKVEFNTLGFRIKAPGNLIPTELDCMLDDLHEFVLLQEKTMLYQLEESNKVFKEFGSNSLENNDFSDDFIISKSNELKSIIRNYFQRQPSLPTDIALEERPLNVERVLSDVQALMTSYKDCKFTGRSIARIFQGISSPNYPALVWSKCKFWRSHIHEDFYGVLKIATQHIIQMKMM